MNGPDVQVVPAQWPVSAAVHAFTTTRKGGVSSGPFGTLNLARHAGDDPALVGENRQRLRRQLQLPGEPRWLTQVHGTRVVDAAETTSPVKADASITDRSGVVCAVLTADCLPLFLCNRAGNRIGIAHVGWRGLAAGIVECAVDVFGGKPSDIIAWMGPAIGPKSFEVGSEVKQALVLGDPESEVCFVADNDNNKWYADLYRLVKLRLQRSGVPACFGDETLCTFSQCDQYFSYRRDRTCGRMASIIWIEQ